MIMDYDDESWWSLITMLVDDDGWQCMMMIDVNDDGWWYIMIDHNARWWDIDDDFDDGWWWWMVMIDDDGWWWMIMDDWFLRPWASFGFLVRSLAFLALASFAFFHWSCNNITQLVMAKYNKMWFPEVC